MIDNIIKAFFAAQDRFESNIHLSKLPNNKWRQEDLLSAAFAAGRMKAFSDILRVELSAAHYNDIISAAMAAERELFETI